MFIPFIFYNQVILLNVYFINFYHKYIKNRINIKKDSRKRAKGSIIGDNGNNITD